jgi:hypothetical protein
MMARSVTTHLKPNSVPAFTQALEKQVIPLLRRRKGFADELTFVVPGGREAVGLSIWEKQEDADAYARGGYPEVLKALGNVLEGTPQIHNLEVCNSTSHKIAASVAA